MTTVAARPFDYTLSPGRTALVVIDMQRDFVEPGGFGASLGNDVTRLHPAIAPIAALLAAWRARGWLVLHTRECHRPDLSDCPPSKLARSEAAGARIGSAGPLGRLLVRGEPGHAIADEVAPVDGELVVDKPGYSAFHATDLHAQLQARGIHTLLLCGLTTEVCVHSTLRHAVDLGYRCTLIGDACAASEAQHQGPALSMVGVEGGIFGRLAVTAEVRWQLEACDD